MEEHRRHQSALKKRMMEERSKYIVKSHSIRIVRKNIATEGLKILIKNSIPNYKEA
jgi:hypothetical protein